MKLTADMLRANATARSYERGESYYHNRHAVGKLVKKGDVYRAEVAGSAFKPYQQTIDLRGTEMVATCTCQYSSGGYCKHIVAVGFAIINEAFTEIEEAYMEVAEVADSDFWEKTFLTTDEKNRNRFLKQLFEKNEDLRRQFNKFTDQNPETLSFENIDEIRDILQKDQLTSISSPIEQKLQSRVAQLNELDAIKILLGIYEACNSETVETDLKKEMWSKAEKIYLNYAKRTVMRTDTAKELISLIFNRWRKYQNQIRSSKNSISFDLSDWQAILAAIAHESVVQQFLAVRLTGYGLTQKDLPDLFARLQKRENKQ